MWGFIPDVARPSRGEWRQALECHGSVMSIHEDRWQRRDKLISFKSVPRETNNGRRGTSSS